MAEVNNSRLALTTSIAVGVISLCALVVSLYQSRIMTQQNELQRETMKAQLWPRLEFVVSRAYEDGITHFALHAKNQGSGPAIIESVDLQYKKKSYPDWWDLLDHMSLPDSVQTYITNRTINHSVIRPGEDLIFLDLSEYKELMYEVDQRSSHIDIKICYRSVFGDSWEIRSNFASNDDSILPVETCKPAVVEFQN